MGKVIIVNPDKLKNLKNKIFKDEGLKFYVISDFERTLTYLFVDSKKITSLISVLRDENYLGSKYSEKAQALFEEYHHIEIDSRIPIKEKKEKMDEWWRRHYKILIEFCFNKKQLEKVVNSGKVKLRGGCLEFLDFLYKHNIPLLIISSSGLGGEAIYMILRREGKLYQNIHIISNFLKWDEKENFVGVKEPIIHSMNKDGSLIRKLPVFKTIKNRKNVLLLGDNIEDCQMINGLDYENLIKTGFLNEEVEKNLDAYKKNFDILILNDGNMNYINDLLKEVIS